MCSLVSIQSSPVIRVTKVLNFELFQNVRNKMWQLVLILSQFVVFVISEDVTNVTTENSRTTGIEANIPLLR